MYHQWFNSREFEDKANAVMYAMKDLGPKPIRYGEQPNYEEKMEKLMESFNQFVEFCKAGHEKEVRLKENTDDLQRS